MAYPGAYHHGWPDYDAERTAGERRRRLITKIARDLHAAEHNEDGRDAAHDCNIGWHTDTWFRHMAETAIDAQDEGAAR